MSIAARPFAFPYRGRLDPAATALMVIDMQVDFLAPDGYFALKGYDPAPLRAIIPAVASLVAAARAVGMLVVWTRQGYRADLADLTPYERYRNARAGVEVGGPGPNGPLLTRGGRGFEIVPELPPAAGEPIVDKTANGAFCYTDLEHVLRWRGITHLIFTGCTTDVCVHTTLREANDRNFQCLLVEDACASGGCLRPRRGGAHDHGRRRRLRGRGDRRAGAGGAASRRGFGLSAAGRRPPGTSVPMRRHS